MLKAIIKNTAPLVLLFALFFLTGAVSTTISLAEHGKGDACCQDGTTDPASPSSGTECTDSECRCLSCSVPLLTDSFSTSPFLDSSLSFWSQTWFIPAAPESSIDYPPEFS